MKKSVTLRAVLKSNKICSKGFEEAEALAIGIFEGRRYVPLPFYTEHGEGHCVAVESLLDKIIWKNGDGVLDEKRDFIPSPEEAMYLLSAVWLKDIGMWYGIFDSERPEDLQNTARVIKMRDKHEIRTSQYIQDKWTKKDCSWQTEEKDWLSNICVYHRGHHPMNTFEPVKESGRRIANSQVRLSVLAALVRLADACHVDKRRAPQRVMGLYLSLGMPKEARVHWERADLIKDVRFDHDERRIVLEGHYPRKFDFGLGVFDVQEVGEMICDDVRKELRNVKQTLSAFSNTDFREVLHDSHHLLAKDYKQKLQCLHLWPYFLSRPFSATEAAAALAQMLLLSAEQAEESGDLGEEWRKDMRQIMEKTKDLRQHDFMIRNLCVEVENRVSGLAENAKLSAELREYLTKFMKSLEENCASLVGHALKEIKPKEVLVVYGHSTNVERLLRNIDKMHVLYIVDCYKPLGGYQVFDENKKIVEVVNKLGFTNYKFLQLESLAGALWDLERKKRPCKLLLGTHGRLKRGDLLCKVGSNMIAATAKRFGVEVVGFCETRKFLVNGESDADVAAPEKLFSSEEEKKHPLLVDVHYMAAKIDLIPAELVDKVVTERGVEATVSRLAAGGESRLEEIINRRLIKLPLQVRYSLHPVLSEPVVSWAVFRTSGYFVLAFIDETEKERIRSFELQKLRPFPALVAEEEDRPIAFKVKSSKKNIILDKAVVRGMFALQLAKDTTLVLRDFSQSVKIKEIGDCNYEIKLGYIVSFGREINQVNFIDFIEDTIAYSLRHLSKIQWHKEILI